MLTSSASKQYAISVREYRTMTVRIISGNGAISFDIDDLHGNIDHYDDGYAQILIDADGDH